MSASLSSLVLQRLAQPAHRRQHLLERLGQLVGRLDQAGVERADVAFLAEALVLAGGARAHLLAHQGEELLGRAQHRAVGEPRLPVGRGQRGGEVEQAAQRLVRLDVVAQQVAQPALQAARAAAAAASAPRIQRRRSEASTPLRCAPKAPSAASNR